MIKQLLILLVVFSAFTSCVCNKSTDKNTLLEIVRIQDLQNELIIENSRVTTDWRYIQLDSAKQIILKATYEKYYVLYQKVKDLNSYISELKEKIINDENFNYEESVDSLNAIKNSIVSFQSENISPHVKNYYLEEIESLRINDEINLSENDEIMFKILYLSMIQSKFSLMLSIFGSFNFIQN